MKAKARGKVSPAVDEYLINHAGRMSQRELAAKCGVGTSTVNRRLAELRQEGRLVPKPVESEEARDSRVGDEDGAQNTAGRLRELRDILHGHLVASEGQGLTRISSEYRATVMAIDELEGKDADGGPSTIEGIFLDLSGY